MAKYLVTGGAGFIGSHIVDALIKQGHSVRILDNISTGRRENLSHLAGRIDLWEVDILDYKTCLRMVDGIDFVLHQAALPSVVRSIDNPLLTNEVNIKGTLNMLLASKEAKVKRFIFASSSSVYGDDPTMPKVEYKTGNPLSPYSISKRAGEDYCRIFSKIYGLYTVCLRYFNVFGPRQDSSSSYAAVVPKFIALMLAGNSPVIFGDGFQTRDFTYVSNVVDATILASKARNVSGEVFNVAYNERTSIDSLASNINKILKTEIPFLYDKIRVGDVRHSYADISKAIVRLKYKPLVPFKTGLKKTIDWTTTRRENELN